MRINTYEIRRRWYGFWKAMRGNAWYRNRIIGFFILATVVAFDLLSNWLCWSVGMVIAGVVLGCLIFWWYEKAFRYLSMSILIWPRFELGAVSRYCMMPIFSLAISSLVGLLCGKARWAFWRFTFLALGLMWFVCLVQAVMQALEELAWHEHQHNVAGSIVRIFQNDDPESQGKMALVFLRDYVRKGTKPEDHQEEAEDPDTKTPPG